MTKAEFVEELSMLNDFESKAAASRAVEMMIDIIKEKLASGEEVNISGLGKFYPAQQAARTGTAPLGGRTWTSPAKTVPKFRPAAQLKRAV